MKPAIQPTFNKTRYDHQCSAARWGSNITQCHRVPWASIRILDVILQCCAVLQLFTQLAIQVRCSNIPKLQLTDWVKDLPKSVNLFFLRCMNSAYSPGPSILLSCRTRGRLVTIPAEFHQIISNITKLYKRAYGTKVFSEDRNREITVPETRGRKSFPTTLSNTEDSPELCRTYR